MWSRDNPNWMEETHTQHPQKANVWAGIIGDRIIGPIFIDGNLNGDRYLELLENEIVPAVVTWFSNLNGRHIPAETI